VVRLIRLIGNVADCEPHAFADGLEVVVDIHVIVFSVLGNIFQFVAALHFLEACGAERVLGYRTSPCLAVWNLVPYRNTVLALR
jgi:hypothetical protein